MANTIKYKALRIIGLAILLSASACKDSTTVQTKYVADRDICHKKADGLVGSYFTDYSYQPSEEDKEKASAQIFCDCMKSSGWHVGACPKPPKPVVVVAPAAAVPGE